MASNKQQKKKERERRVAKKKLAAAAERREREKLDNETRKGPAVASKLMKQPAVPKPDYVASNKKSPFTQRRGGS